MGIRDDLDLASLDLIEVRRNGIVVDEFYVEPEQQPLIESEVSRMKAVLDPPQTQPPKLVLVPKWMAPK